MPEQGLVTLEGQVARHMVQVLRLSAGEQVELFDGRRRCLARLQQGQRQRVSLEIEQTLDCLPASPLRVHLGQGIGKGERMDWVIQKATELGVAAITPLYTQQSEVRLKGDREEKKMRHWQQVAISACEQSGRDDLPVIHAPQPLTRWLEMRTETLRLLLHPGQSPELMSQTQPRVSDLAILVGPEGGWHASEVSSALAQGFHCWTLGPRVMRMETAPVAALAILQQRWGDLAFEE